LFAVEHHQPLDVYARLMANLVGYVTIGVSPFPQEPCIGSSTTVCAKWLM
jgi:hypothetical protein